jgi:hypothetical protein
MLQTQAGGQITSLLSFQPAAGIIHDLLKGDEVCVDFGQDPGNSLR